MNATKGWQESRPKRAKEVERGRKTLTWHPFPKSVGFIPNIKVVKRPKKVFGRRRQNLNGDWTNLPSTTVDHLDFVTAPWLAAPLGTAVFN